MRPNYIVRNNAAYRLLTPDAVFYTEGRHGDVSFIPSRGQKKRPHVPMIGGKK
ncbi:hypothetical protein DEHRE_11940 [Dehalobacter restrictus DSM 9455]|uniref:Uncharacterized protein n=1 Tax=Dehalobacter restrictus (strain DSM 9455 / PER-K23) TaxID=871738 RepID=A0ABM5P9Z1_DEHRP|nr:hypothetical protein DEHRE_11940 [Dehalobacter restrictus DSM 9455]